jgi:hydrogenase-4 component B
VARLSGCGFALSGTVLTALASVWALAHGTAEWTLGSSVPLFAYSFALDGLSAYFNLALSVLAVAVSIYSFGYLESMEGRRNLGVLTSLFNGLLLSLTIVFSASNAFLFMIGWELMALTAYGLVTYEHRSEESRNAGLLYLIMSHADAGCLLLGFGSKNARSGDYEHPARLFPEYDDSPLQAMRREALLAT